ncbi:MAG TPA: RHS repeat-associated core domain-containing protein [Stellaceae bacterium]|nr:RHS repeat-associated core domain-containing protein [Stellaceae bacterium]
MKALAAVAALLSTLLLHSVVAAAQECTTPVVAWVTDYTLRAMTAANSPCPNSGSTGETCTVNHSSSARGLVNISLQSCEAITWVAHSLQPTFVTANDSFSSPCLVGSVTQTLSQPRNGKTDEFLTLDLSTATFTFEPDATSDATNELVSCDGSKTSNPQPFVYYPAESGSVWPRKLPLPSTIQSLKGAPSFHAIGFAPGLADWTFNFELDPVVLDDKDCLKVVGSEVGCSNQRLGEDEPLAGTGFHLHYASDRAPSGLGSVAAVDDAAMIGGWTLSVHHALDPVTGTLFLGNGGQRSAYQLGAPVSAGGNRLVASEDGVEVYVFSGSTGEHLKTVRPRTGAVIYQFGYDGAFRLTKVTDAGGNVTRIKRNGSGQPTAIVAPFGQTTALTLDANGFLSRITDPLGHAAIYAYAANGLLTSRTDRNGHKYSYTYAGGRVTKTADPVGGFTTLSRSKSASGLGWASGFATAMGTTSNFSTAITASWLQDGTQPYSDQHINTWPSGLQARTTTSLQGGKLVNTSTLPRGTSVSETLGPDPVWGLQMPVVTSRKRSEATLTQSVTSSRSTTLYAAADPFSVAVEKTTQSVNGRTSRITFTGSTRTEVRSSPAGRITKLAFDALERPASVQFGGQLRMDLAYDSHGRLASTTQGTRMTVFGYGADGLLATATDPAGRPTRFAYDAAGQLIATTLPGGRVVEYGYDPNGNRISVTPPGAAPHRFTYTRVDLMASYRPPAVAGAGATTYAYDLDRRITKTTRPDGSAISYGYDSAGRPISMTMPTGTTKLGYAATTGHLAKAETPDATVTYAYSGALPTRSTWSGPVEGSVSRVYSTDFWVTEQKVAGTPGIAYAYDEDGLTTQAGALAISRRASDGLVAGTALGAATDSRSYDGYGELSAYTASANGKPLWKRTYTRDADGRVTKVSEAINGAGNTYAYTYDVAGRLSKAVRNGAADSYTYGLNSSRITAVVGSGTTLTGTYDAQDRLLKYGAVSFTYTANGELASRKAGGQTTTYGYDALGNLLAATLPNGTKIAYLVDAEGRRVGKRVNGALRTGFLYDDAAIVAQLDGANHVMRRFVYGTRATTPDYVISGGTTYRIFSDDRGSPVLVVNTATGAVAEQITYDEFGNVIADTNPGLQPFRFAGGLYDSDTKLLHFGAREYDPSTGRWTAKDPLRFNSSDTNLYDYVMADPVNLTDPTGLEDESCWEKFVDLLRYLVGKPKVGPITIDPETRSISTGASIGVKVEGQTVAEATGTVRVGITQGSDPNGNLFTAGAEVDVKALGWTVAHAEAHTEFGNASNLRVEKNLQSQVARDKELELCNDFCP